MKEEVQFEAKDLDWAFVETTVLAEELCLMERAFMGHLSFGRQNDLSSFTLEPQVDLYPLQEELSLYLVTRS
jgi:hypothetical protein